MNFEEGRRFDINNIALTSSYALKYHKNMVRWTDSFIAKPVFQRKEISI